MAMITERRKSLGGSLLFSHEERRCSKTTLAPCHSTTGENRENSHFQTLCAGHPGLSFTSTRKQMGCTGRCLDLLLEGIFMQQHKTEGFKQCLEISLSWASRAGNFQRPQWLEIVLRGKQAAKQSSRNPHRGLGVFAWKWPECTYEILWDQTAFPRKAWLCGVVRWTMLQGPTGRNCLSFLQPQGTEAIPWTAVLPCSRVWITPGLQLCPKQA